MHKHPPLPESTYNWRVLKVDPRAGCRHYGLKGHAPRGLAGVDQVKREEMTKQGHGRGNAHHGLADEGEDGKENDGLRIQVQRVDLVMG